MLWYDYERRKKTGWGTGMGGKNWLVIQGAVWKAVTVRYGRA